MFEPKADSKDMPSILLTDAFLRNIRPTNKLAEYPDKRVPCLSIRVSPGGTKSWAFRYRPKDSSSQKRLALGRYPEVSLALARTRAEEQRVAVGGGHDPQGERRTRRETDRAAPSFNDLADEYLNRYAKPLKKSWRNDELYLRVHVRPAWGDRKAKSITRADAATLLDRIAITSPVTGNRVQATLSKLWNWSIESGLLDVNPAAQMKKRAREVAKDRTLSPDEIRVLWRVLTEGSIAAAMRFLLLTGLRPGEAAGIAIAELYDLDDDARARLEIPGSRMKSGRPHVLPLAPMALAIIRHQVAAAGAGQTYVFPSVFELRGPIARNSLSQALQRLIDGLHPGDGDGDTIARLKAARPTPHDLRRTTASGLAECGVAREDRLGILAHAINDVHGRVYDRHDRFAEKQRALVAWERHLMAIINPPRPPATSS